jgi:DNA-binding response OmpR family regulator
MQNNNPERTTIMTTNKITKPTNTTKQANILLIGSFSKSTDPIKASLEVFGYHVEQIPSLSKFEEVTLKSTFDIFVSAVDSSKFNTDELFELASLVSPSTPVVGFSENPSPSSVVDFIRLGGVDFFCIPDDISLIAERVQTVLGNSLQAKELKENAEQSLQLCNTMNEELQRVSDENDALCSDLANSHCETQKKIKQASVAAEFQTLVNQELEIDSMLRTALGYLLTRIGATNAAVYLNEGDVDWGIGAYINYDRQPDQFQTLIDTIGSIACPTISDEPSLARFVDGETFANTVGADAVDFSGSEVVTIGCCYEDRCMATIVLFRGDTKPFDQECLDTLETIQTIFGHQLGTILKIHRRAETNWPSESIDDDEWNYGKAA